MVPFAPFVVAQASSSLGESSVALFDPTVDSGLIGWPDVAISLGRLVVKTAARQHARDADALARMIEIARGLVPVDSGLLLSGITGEISESYSEFRASAVHSRANGKDGADYARFVEFGTRAGEASTAAPITAHEGFFASDQFGVTGMRGEAIVKNRRSRRSHGGTAAQPYFFPAADEVIGDRAEAAGSLPYEVAGEEGWSLA
jgi:hypothetical protein